MGALRDAAAVFALAAIAGCGAQESPRVALPAAAPITAAADAAPAPSVDPDAGSHTFDAAATDAPALEAASRANTCMGDDLSEIEPLLRGDSDAQRSQPWSTLSPGVVRDVRAGKPLVVYVVVPLCSNDQISCGSPAAGRPGGLATNIYWGAIFGSRRFFDDYHTPFERVETKSEQEPYLERIVYRQRVSGAPWGLAADVKVEQIVVLHAVHGTHINHAVARVWSVATKGDCITFDDGGITRTERIHVVGYAGHNRLMDGVRLPPPPPQAEAAPIPSFVLACYSDRYWGKPLRSAGARPLMTTNAFMAPEGYLVRSMAVSLARNDSPAAIREAAATAQRAWQKTITPSQARGLFWPFEL